MGYRLFEVVGIELEYMVVSSHTLKVCPIVDKLLTLKNGSLTSDIDNGAISWSNELVGHVVELKTNGPAEDITLLSKTFHDNVVEINGLLKTQGAQLLPTAAHPLMDPKTEMQLWKHSYSEVYALYNRIFNCKGHGWANVQSMHINLPFFDDTEFEKLHAAIRVLLPIIPGLCASSPIFEGSFTGFMDARMEVYKTNQKEIPEMTGKVIPEQVFSQEEYSTKIFDPINRAIAPFDTDHILDHHFLNSRGAIARFDRNAIEIRVIDVQECPKADLAIAILIVEVLKFLVGADPISLSEQKKWHEDDLFPILNLAIKEAEAAYIANTDYLALFGLGHKATVGEVWNKLYQLVKGKIPESYRETLEIQLAHGTLSSRILKALHGNFEPENCTEVYQKLADCLETNRLFVP